MGRFKPPGRGDFAPIEPIENCTIGVNLVDDEEYAQMKS